MARKVKHKSTCPICKKGFDTAGYTIRQGILQGVFVADTHYCSKKCEDKFIRLIEALPWKDSSSVHFANKEESQ